MCGGTRTGGGSLRDKSGLSPRVRGNPRPQPGGAPQCGSIPACAGEPGCPQPAARGRAVYPRVCGGTVHHGTIAPGASGLSPRVRGNLKAARPVFADSGSIPACAGEPLPLASVVVVWRVYPRVCGGTTPARFVRGEGHGLSPRVRGNLSACFDAWQDLGSIPACAGEPRIAAIAPGRLPVYPRVCGGTESDLARVQEESGLSPRVRGNRPEQLVYLNSRRSIPACAGEPSTALPQADALRVYPRVCGGTK